ncbi:MAG: Nif3-like dinuclear metal center hexameric protein [Flavobacteriaceae bacterium]|jgi:dinuclear metal center YbgI/SA1388 family protein|nr:Nif3-like dinuclear metal center hexameric protein [Flavobacteriaceae bacterium]
MIVQQLLETLDQWAPNAYAEDFDNVGLLVGDPKTKCSGVLITLDCTEAVVDEALSKKCNVILSFHPIIFSGLKKITGANYVERVVQKAIKNDLAIIALHTRLDNHPQGVNHVLCERLGMVNTQVLIPKKDSLKKLVTYVPKSHSEHVLEALHKVGAGNLDNYSECSFLLEGTGHFTGNEGSTPHLGKKLEKTSVQEIQINVVFESHLLHPIQKALHQAHPYETVAYEIYHLINSYAEVGMGRIGFLEKEMDLASFLNFVKKQLNTEHLRYSPDPGKPIKKVAVLGGSGSFAIEDAKRQNADAFITADLKYHQFYQGEKQLVLLDVGHYESEQFTKNLIFDYLTKKLPNFAFVLSRTKTNPVNYL